MKVYRMKDGRWVDEHDFLRGRAATSDVAFEIEVRDSLDLLSLLNRLTDTRVLDKMIKEYAVRAVEKYPKEDQTEDRLRFFASYLYGYLIAVDDSVFDRYDGKILREAFGIMLPHLTRYGKD
jgi:hypothetical protein